MKKHTLFKTLVIFFMIMVVLTWIIPTGAYSNGELVKGDTSPIGIFSLFRLPLATIGTFLQYGFVFMAIGGFYEVLNATGVYVPFVNKVAKKFQGKEFLFLGFVIGGFALFASLTALSFPLFVLVPFFVAVILMMGFKKVTALASTVGAILVGMIGSTYGFNVAGYINYYLSLDVNNLWLTKIILLIMLVFLLIVFVFMEAEKELNSDEKVETKKTKKGAKEETKASEALEIPFYHEESKNKKSPVPMIVITVFAIVLALIMMYNWYYGLNVTFFQDIYTSFMEIKIGDYPIISNLFGGLSQFGYWSYYDLTILLIICSMIIGWIYSVKMRDILDHFFTGCKNMIGVAFYTTICCVICAVLLTSTSSNIFVTISDFFLNISKSFNMFATSALAFIGGFFYNDFYYVLGETSQVLGAKYDAATLPVVGLVFQTMYGLAMMIFPTSVILIAGLSYLKVSYKEWMKYMWKFLLSIFVVIMLVLIISVLFI